MIKQKKIGIAGAIALVVASMVGTGVFTSLGFQTGPLPSVPVILFLWLCGGLVALCGGLSYVELVRLYPGHGGEYHYIAQVYHKYAAAFSGIISVLAGFAGPVALAAMGFSAYLGQLLPGLPPLPAAIAGLTVITLFHLFSLRTGSRFQLISTAVKLLLILVFIIAGLLFSKGGSVNSGYNTWAPHLIFSKGFAVCLVYVSFAYSGWNACVYIYHEIDNPGKNIYRSVITGTILVMVLYFLLNYVFLKTVPLQRLTGVIEVGALSAEAIFGTAGAKIIPGIIALLLVSSISAMVWIGPRVITRISADYGFLRLSRSNSRGAPATAIILQYIITVVLLLSGTFEQVLAFAGVLLNLCSCLAVSVLFLHLKKLGFAKLAAPLLYLAATLYSSGYLIVTEIIP